MEKKLILKMEKGGGSSTITCKDKAHYDRLLARFTKKGYKKVSYVEEPKIDTYPF